MVLIVGNGYGERIRSVKIRISGVVPGTGVTVSMDAVPFAGPGRDQEVSAIG